MIWHLLHRTFKVFNFQSLPLLDSPLLSPSPSLPPSLSLQHLPRVSSMKKLYRKGTVHPSPPIISDHLSFLPATILTLTAALSPEDREVLAYLISCSSNNNILCSNWSYMNSRKSSSRQKTTSYTKNSSSSNNDHPPMFNCDCFRCYMIYWIRWDSSPNRQLIHEIIDAFEDWWLLKQGRSGSSSGKKNKKDRKRKGNSQGSGELIKGAELRMKHRMDESNSVDENRSAGGGGEVAATAAGGGGGEEEVTDKGSVRRFVSFIGERIWGVLG
ncbi:PREDICTED: uncharacterized protein LOC105108157 [Populus euphratica]|uniref:Uncharacterized protein LOC105108157 n=1 Tax=Populus euphratica TaxID=75702 RepID=A0AAJ6X0A4_POPEU|nr:PREDICTED: uncharacterized protein LOC105108157 [Populus euphratica]